MKRVRTSSSVRVSASAPPGETPVFGRGDGSARVPEAVTTASRSSRYSFILSFILSLILRFFGAALGPNSV
jgi:hypothetical protein